MTDFTATRALFDLPDDVIYLDGNSLGPLPHGVQARLADTVAAEWGERLIRAWNDADWMTLPRRVGDRVGRLIGAPEGSVVMGDTLSVKVYQALASALDLKSDRRVVLSDSGNFPTDLYMAEGLLASLARGHELRIVEPEGVAAAIDESVAALMLTEVDYRTGRRHDMPALIRKAHEVGALVIWDLAHSAGALPVDVADANVDFAVGCTYKYLNGGPGSPAFIYVAPRLADDARPALSGWMGHAAPFAFDPVYRPGAGIERMRVGTPPILALAALDAALDVWDDVDMEDIRTASLGLADLFIAQVEARCPQLALASPRDGAMRGSQVSFRHPDGYAIVQALIARGVIGDFRAPDILRFGLTPLYIGEADVVAAVDVMAGVMAARAWDCPEYRKQGLVDMSFCRYDPETEGAQMSFDGRMSYGDYLRLGTILDAQAPLSTAHDEMLFIIQHQTSELWMKLVVHELGSAIVALREDHLQPAFKMLARVSRIFEQLNGAWDVLRTMTPSEYTTFRDSLGQSSGFQSHQYRAIEFLLGNRNLAMLKPHAHRTDTTGVLEAILGAPSLYDEALRLVARHGFDIGSDADRTNWRETRSENAAVLASWAAIYRAPEEHWTLYELAEKLVDLEDYFRRWRFNHVTTVERIIGLKTGTGGTGGVSYLRRMLDVVLFPELWRVRTEL